MDTLAIAAIKGGVGKTTLAVHLAAWAQGLGVPVLLLDLDAQGSAAQWARDRARFARETGTDFAAALSVRRVFANELGEALQASAAEGFGLAIIDAPPQADFAIARAIEAADLTLVPVRPSAVDLYGVRPTLTLIQSLRAHAYEVINQTPHITPGLAEDAKTYLAAKGLAAVPRHITALAAYARAFRDGRTAPELVPHGRHAAEIAALWAFVQSALAQARTEPQHKSSRHAGKGLLDSPFTEILEPTR